jgi:hypothetical protein
MTHRSGPWLGAEAARRLAARDGVEVFARPAGVDVVGLLGHVDIHPPLTIAEIACVQDSFAFEFADDHRAFLAAGLPLGQGWPDWRHGSAEQLRDALTSPVIGVLFDVEHNAFWDHRWGDRPANAGARTRLARGRLARVPQLVPVYGHRYLPAGRGTFGHPVLSIHQTDIICYGTDLVDYMYQEFGFGPGIERTDPRWRPRPTVGFWSELMN